MEEKKPFKVPDNYFRDFKLEIMDKLSEKDNINNVSFLKKLYIKWYAVAAVIFIFILGGIEIVESYKHSYIINPNEMPIAQEQNITSSEQQYATLQNDYLLFVEDQASLSMYNDAIGLDDF